MLPIWQNIYSKTTIVALKQISRTLFYRLYECFEQVFTQQFYGHLKAPGNKYLLKVGIEIVGKGVEYVQTLERRQRSYSAVFIVDVEDISQLFNNISIANFE